MPPRARVLHRPRRMVALEPRNVSAVVAALALASAAPLGRALSRLSSHRLHAAESFAGGASLAYVVVDLLVELTGASTTVHGALRIGPTEEATLFAVVLAGATLWYSAAALAPKLGGAGGEYAAYALPQWVYRLVVGAVLALEADHGADPLVLFALPMLLHLAVVESHFHRQFDREHAGMPRAAVAIAPALGALGWALFGIPDAALFIALAFVAGSTVVQIVQTELPAPELVRVGPFLLGVGLYSALIAARWA